MALGGGRVVDTAKAIAGAGEGVRGRPDHPVGAEMTPFHRTPAGAEGAGWCARRSSWPILG